MAKPHRKLPVFTSQEVQSFWSRVQVLDKNQCWPWMSYRNADGYGYVGINKKYYFAHRIAFYLINGLDPAEKIVCHTCDNPACCNPAHYFLGDNRANIQDA